MKPRCLAALAALALASELGAEIRERELPFAGKTLHYLEAGERAEPAVLLLHGARYSSETWRELGTIDRIAEEGYFVVALDVPGYGRSESVDAERDAVLVGVLDALGVERAVVVAPSMSGQYAFPLVVRAPERVAGFVPIAPAAMDRYLRVLPKVSVPALVLWGENDAIVSVERSDVLAAALAGSRRVIFRDAGHACYLDAPDRFHEELTGFLASLDPR